MSLFREKGSTHMSIEHVGVGSTLSVGQKEEWLIFADEGAEKVAALNLKTMEVETSFHTVEDVHYLSKDEVKVLMNDIDASLSFSDFHISASGQKRV